MHTNYSDPVAVSVGWPEAEAIGLKRQSPSGWDREGGRLALPNYSYSTVQRVSTEASYGRLGAALQGRKSLRTIS